MLNLFSTTSEESGYRLQYMEVFNWGTFTDHIFRIQPEGNNSLLTGANASGKSTFIDALLTLLVPAKKTVFTTNHLVSIKNVTVRKKPMF